MVIAEQHLKWLALASASPTEAIEELDQELVAALRRGNVHDEIALRRALGLAERSRMRLAESISHLEHAISLADQLGEHVTAAHCRNTLAGSLTYAGRSTEALDLMAKVIAELPEPDCSQAEAQLVTILSLAGSHREALEKSQLLLTRFTEQGDAVWGARIRQSRSMIHLYLGDPVAGIADAESAIAIYQSIGNAAGVARTRHNVAALRGLGGDIIGALDLFADVETEFRRLDIPLSIGADGRVATLFAAGLIEDAVNESQSAMRESEQLGAEGLLVEAAVWHALALAQLGRWGEVAKSAAVAKRVFAKQSRPAWEAFALALEVEADVEGLLGATLMCLTYRDPDTNMHAERMVQATRDAAEGMRANGWVQATRVEVIAALVGASADPSGGFPRLKDLSDLRSTGIVEHQLLGWLCAGACEVLEDPSPLGLANAAAVWHEGTRSLTHRFGQFSTLEGNVVTNSVRHTLATAGIAALIRAQEYLKALIWIEEERSTPHRVRLTPGSDVAEEHLLTELRALHIQTASPSSNESVKDLLSRQTELERTLRGKSVSSIPSTDPQPEELTAHRFFGTVPSVTFFVNSDDICVLTLTPTRSSEVKFHRLGPIKSFERTLRNIRSSAERLSLGADQWPSIEEVITHDLSDLDRRLITPWLQAIDEGSDEPQPLLISAPPQLDVAWCALPSLRSRDISLVSSLESSTAGLTTNQSEVPITRELGLVVSIAGPNLECAKSEVEAIGRIRRGRVVLADGATRDEVRNTLATAHTVHLACHATLRHDQPLFSSLELADGPLFLHDLARSGQVSPIIVLSACNAGRTSSRSGGGAAGFARTLLSLGATTVVAPLVPVSDVLMVAPMVEFHRLLAESDRRSIARPEVWESLPTSEALRRIRCSTTLTAQESFTAALCVAFVASP